MEYERKKVDFNNSKILITGGTGSWGNELTKQLLEKYNPEEIRIYSRGEFAQVEMARKFIDSRLKFVIGDVRDYEPLMTAMNGIDYVFHLAALKHVPICEENPEECIKTNIDGVKTVIRAAIDSKIKIVIDSSTDKACNPLNLYGCSKSVGEKLIIKANSKSKDTRFVCVRAGNVMGTRGSIIPFFKELIKEDKIVPITDVRMTRYIMHISEAITLLFKATESCFGGEIFVTKMPASRVIDIAQVLADTYNKKLKTKNIGIRPGEKIHEVLVSEYEAPYTVEDENFKIILPFDGSLTNKYLNSKKVLETEYASDNELLNKKELLKLLQTSGFLDDIKG